MTCVYQKSTVIPGLTVAESLFLHRQPTNRWGVVADRPAREVGAGGPGSARLLGGRIPIVRMREFALVPAIVAVAIAGWIVDPVFVQRQNLINILQTMSEIALLVLAQALVLIVRKMDLSLESTMGWPPGSRPGSP